MKRFIAVCFLLCAFTLEVLARPQESMEDEDYGTDSADFTTHPLTFAPINNRTATALAVSAPLQSKFASQCLYDFNGKRLNKDCSAETPPKCEKGHLVSTLVGKSAGEEYEMCCCNFSNFL